MGKYFRVDRINKYQAGSAIRLALPVGIPDDFKGITLKMSPNGYSSHGENYFLKPVPATDTSSSIDFSLELFRRAFYPHLPSRYSSVFACEELAGAEKFRSLIINQFPEAAIYEIECDSSSVHRGDMKLLNNLTTTLVYAERLDLYWRGKTVNADPFWEILAPLPVKVIKKIN